MKRKREEEIETANKRITNNWISATSLKNYMNNDPIIDWFERTKSSSSNQSSTRILFEYGHKFEADIIDRLKRKIDIVTISDIINDESCQETITHMKKGTPFIHSAPLRNDRDGTHGIADLLVRSDHINLLCEDIEKYSIPNIGCELSRRYHYIVIDIKYTTLPLRADGIHLLNSGLFSAYKSQLLVYNRCLEIIQGYFPNYAFILGRRWRYESKGEIYSGKSPFEKLGKIDYGTIDLESVIKTDKAIEWIKNVKENGHLWKISPPSRSELYPNMNNSTEWETEKKDIANKIGEITMLWNCGIKQREKAHQKNIKSWKDKRLTGEVLGFSGERLRVFNDILAVNRSKDKVRPIKIKSNLYDWRKKSNEAFIDFETFADIKYSDVENQEKSDFIFMIGLLYKGEYKTFILKEISREGEFNIMNEFIDYYNSCGKPRLWYWHADQSIWERELSLIFESASIERQTAILEWNLEWCDLCHFIRNEPVVIRGCFGFGLKEITNTLNSYGFIKTHFDGNMDGFQASLLAWDALNNKDFNSIKEYNKSDVTAVYEILTYLRKNH